MAGQSVHSNVRPTHSIPSFSRTTSSSSSRESLRIFQVSTRFRIPPPPLSPIKPYVLLVVSTLVCLLVATRSLRSLRHPLDHRLRPPTLPRLSTRSLTPLGLGEQQQGRNRIDPRLDALARSSRYLQLDRYRQ